MKRVSAVTFTRSVFKLGDDLFVTLLGSQQVVEALIDGVKSVFAGPADVYLSSDDLALSIIVCSVHFIGATMLITLFV